MEMLNYAVVYRTAYLSQIITCIIMEQRFEIVYYS